YHNRKKSIISQIHFFVNLIGCSFPSSYACQQASLRLSVSARLSPSSQRRGYGHRRNNSLSVELKLSIFRLLLLMSYSPFLRLLQFISLYFYCSKNTSLQPYCKKEESA